MGSKNLHQVILHNSSLYDYCSETEFETVVNFYKL